VTVCTTADCANPATGEAFWGEDDGVQPERWCPYCAECMDYMADAHEVRPLTEKKKEIPSSPSELIELSRVHRGQALELEYLRLAVEALAGKKFCECPPVSPRGSFQREMDRVRQAIRANPEPSGGTNVSDVDRVRETVRRLRAQSSYGFRTHSPVTPSSPPRYCAYGDDDDGDPA
jgi:hypothetical protein